MGLRSPRSSSKTFSEQRSSMVSTLSNGGPSLCEVILQKCEDGVDSRCRQHAIGCPVDGLAIPFFHGQPSPLMHRPYRWYP